MTNRNMKLARAPRDYKREYAQYHSKPRMVAERAQRNQARRIVGLAKGDPREVDHKNPISNGGSNAKSNLRAISLVENRTKFTKTAEERQRNPYLLPAASFGGAALAATLATKRYKGITKHLANRLENIGGDRRAAEMASEIPKGVRDNARAIIKSLIDSGVDPSKARIGIAATGGTGKTTLGRALSEELGILHTKLDINNSASFGGHDAYLTKNPVTPGTVVDQTHLFTQADPEKHFDVMIHLKRPTKDIKEGLLKRKRGAHQVDLYDYDKLSKDIETGFNAAGGKTIYSNPGDPTFRTTTTVKIKDGNNWGGNVNNKLLSLGISPGKLNKMSYEDKVLTLSEGRRTKGTGPLRYVNYTAPANIGLATVAGGAAPFAVSSLYDNREKFTKTASTKHHLITGVPGAGKSTIARRIAKEKGLPLFEIDSDPRFKHALQLIDEGKIDESNALQKQMFHDAIARKDPHVIEGAQVMLDPTLARQHELQILDGSVDELAPRWANREAIKHRERAVSAGKLPTKDETYYDSLYRNTVYPRYQEQLAGLRKTASSQHYLVTGHSGAGKSTLARKLSEETGAPIISLDDVPSIRALLEEQKATAKASGGKLDLSPETTAKKKAVELKAIQDAIAAKNPAIIEGSYLLDHDPSMFKGHKMMLVDRARDSILDQRVERQRLRDLSNGKEWSDARAAGVRARGSQLLDYYQPGVDTWRNSSLVEKRATAVATKTDPAKWEAAKQEAKSKMGGKHSARAMQLATKIYKDNGGGYSGAKPTSSTNSLKKWTKQDWGYSGKDKPGPGGTGVYLPKQRRIALKSSEEGKKLLAAATRRKTIATKRGQQYSSHGLAAGTSLQKQANMFTNAINFTKGFGKNLGSALKTNTNTGLANAANELSTSGGILGSTGGTLGRSIGEAVHNSQPFSRQVIGNAKAYDKFNLERRYASKYLGINQPRLPTAPGTPRVYTTPGRVYTPEEVSQMTHVPEIKRNAYNRLIASSKAKNFAAAGNKGEMAGNFLGNLADVIKVASVQWSFAKENTSSIKEAFALYKEANYKNTSKEILDSSDDIVNVVNNANKMVPALRQGFYKGKAFIYAKEDKDK